MTTRKRETRARKNNNGRVRHTRSCGIEEPTTKTGEYAMLDIKMEKKKAVEYTDRVGEFRPFS